MSFLNPAALWSFLALIPLIALYFLKVRPNKKPTTALFLWDRIFEEKKQNGLFKNLRDLISLIMILLAFSAIVLAMARPVMTPKDSKRDLVLIIDNSASMSTKDGLTDRLTAAKTLAENIVKSLTSTQNVVIASISDSLEIRTNATNNQQALLAGIEAITQTQLPLESHELSTIADNKKIIPESRFILISDGCFKNAANLNDLELLKVGKTAGNIGITSFDLRRIPAADNAIGLFFQLVSTFKETQEVDVTLAHGSPDNIVKIIPMTVKPGDNKPKILKFSDQRLGKWYLSIEIKDALELDNLAYAQLNPPTPLRIKLDVPDDQPFFRQCIDSFRLSGQLMKLDDDSPDMSISFNGEGSSLNKIIFQPQGESPYWQGQQQKLDTVIPKVLMAEHPAIRFCALDTLPFEGARKITAPENSIILVENEDKTPLLYKTRVDDVTAFVVNMDPMKSQLYFNIYFPIIIYSLSYDLAGREANQQFNYPTGASIPSKAAKITGPTGEIKANSQGFKAPVSGFYEAVSDQKTERFAASLNNRFESMVSNDKIKNTAKEIESSFPVTDLLLIIALLLVATECMLYHRRIVG